MTIEVYKEDQVYNLNRTNMGIKSTPIKKVSSYTYKEIKMDHVQSHIWLTASSYMGKNLRFSSYIRKPFLIYDFAPDPIWISLYVRIIFFSFCSVRTIKRQEIAVICSVSKDVKWNSPITTHIWKEPHRKGGGGRGRIKKQQ